MPTSAPPFRPLAWGHFALLLAGLVGVAVSVAVMIGPERIYDQYARVAVGRFRGAYGFEVGIIQLPTRRCGPDRLWGVVKVAEDGEFTRLGVRSGDVVFERHGMAGLGLYDALRAAAEGRDGYFEVINAVDFAADCTAPPRGITVPAR